MSLMYLLKGHPGAHIAKHVYYWSHQIKCPPVDPDDVNTNSKKYSMEQVK